MSKQLYDAIKDRRSIYALGKDHVVSKDRVREIVEFAVTHTPSAFNSQSGRAVVLFERESSRFWGVVREALRSMVPAEAFAKTDEKISSFDAGYGTILFFEDQTAVEGLMSAFPLYKDYFPVWSLQSNGMLEFAVWTALESEGLGASLQHYNPLIDAEVKRLWDIPDSWKLLAEMPFGSVAAPPDKKVFGPIAPRVRIVG